MANKNPTGRPGKTASKNLLEGSVGRWMFDLAAPMSLGIIAVMSYHLADTWFIAQLGTDQLAALSLTFPVVMVINNLAIGLGIGATSLVSRYLGNNEGTTARRVSFHCLLLAVCLVGATSVAGLLTIEPLFRLLGGDETTLPLVEAYMSVWYGGMVFIVVPMVGNSLIRAHGNTKSPAIIMSISALVNVILDPIFIFGFGPIPALGIEGAGYATVVGNFITFALTFYYIFVKNDFVKVCLPGIRKMVEVWKEILELALPVAGNNMLKPLAYGVITSLAASYSREAVAAFGIATRIESFAVIPFLALTAGMSPFVGQHFGAKSFKRIKKSLHLSYKFSIAYGVSVAGILFFAADGIVKLFEDTEQVVYLAAFYLTVVPITYVMEGILLSSNTVFNASGYPMKGALLTGLKMIGVYVPVAYGLAYFFDAKGIFFAAVFANISGGSAAYFVTKRFLAKQEAERT